jgi:hypothetical protein
MDEVLGALSGLGLYGLPVSDLGPKQKRGSDDERKMHSSPGGVSYDSAASRTDEEPSDVPGWQRDRMRRRARNKRNKRRYLVGGAVGVVVLIAVIVTVVLLAVNGGKAPYVVGRTLDQARTAAEKAGMKVEVSAQVPTFNEPAGTVLQQLPAKGIKSDDRKLRVTVAKQPVLVTATFKAYDPPPGDGKENNDTLVNLGDNKESTTWSTELYKTAAFGNLKAGVGFEFTLSEPASIMKIVSTVDGWSGELRQVTSSGSPVKITDLVGSSKTYTLQQPISSGRIWFTKLVELSPGRYGVELSEVEFYK